MVLLDHLFWYLYSYTIIAKREAFQHIVYTVHFLKEMPVEVPIVHSLKGMLLYQSQKHFLKALGTQPEGD